MMCRYCGAPLSKVFVDLATAPPSNAYLTTEMIKGPEKWFPLRVLLCTNCWLVQTEDYLGASELFPPDYAYFSSFSTTWLDHAKRYVETMISRFKMDKSSFVVEVGANDGYLLQHVVKAGIPCLGIEPTRSTAEAARRKGIETVEAFFGIELAKKLADSNKHADLIVTNNILAHVPNINDFVSGYSILLRPNGIATFEFPSLFRLVSENQFDTIYHEHYSYLSLTVVDRIFNDNGLFIFDVEELPTHGGSLRVFACKKESRGYRRSERVNDILTLEKSAGMNTLAFYSKFQEKVEMVKNDFVAFLIDARRNGKKVVGYGAAAKGNTLFNYGGVHSDLVAFVADLNPWKQGKYMPGSRIPIVSPDMIRTSKPDYIIILPWNLKAEIMSSLSYVRE
ncbi:MAG: class I SAM-dependent methyltransferase, partial [Candidatus Lokiarchaeota archaeon]|nr:class I SAM-dependent methyltransferase [Candidatus Lokiarchaeota archaeon]